MRLRTLSLAASLFVTSGIVAVAVEMIKPFEALEQSRRAMSELNKRQTQEGAERRRREKEDEAKRKREEAEQRKKEAEQRKRQKGEAVQQQAQRKRDAAAAKAPQEATAASSVPTQPAAAPTLASEPRAQAAPAPPDTQATEREPPVDNASPPRPHAPSSNPPHLTGPLTGRPDERGARSGTSQSQVGVGQGQRDPQSASGSPAPPSAKPNDVAAPAKAASGQAIPVSRLKSMNLYNERGDKLGDVEQVVQSPDGNFHIVIGSGGFLGVRERDVRIPLERVTLRRNGLVIQGLTDDQVKVMPVFDRTDRTYRDLDRNTTVPVVRDPSEK
jgi:sporulation protein YlmC with PRC-barrel domain